MGRFAAARLQRHLARCPQCAAEMAETRALWAELRALAAVPVDHPAPLWPSFDTVLGPARPQARTFAIGGLTMKKRTVAITCALTVFSVSGAALAERYLAYRPFQDSPDGRGNLWGTTGHFRGEVKTYRPDGSYIGSLGMDDSDRPGISAEVTVNGETFPLSGAGRHPLTDENGKLLGFADLVPETPAERQVQWRAYEHRGGIEERLLISYGATDGHGTAVGFFGDEPNRLTWRMDGVGEVRFYRADNGHFVYYSDASAVDPSQVDNLRRSLGSAAETSVNAHPPATPTFRWTVGDRTSTSSGYDRPFTIALANGIKLRVEIVRSHSADAVTNPCAAPGPCPPAQPT
jgi:hypothetical protein